MAISNRERTIAQSIRRHKGITPKMLRDHPNRPYKEPDSMKTYVIGLKNGKEVKVRAIDIEQAKTRLQAIHGIEADQIIRIETYAERQDANRDFRAWGRDFSVSRKDAIHDLGPAARRYSEADRWTVWIRERGGEWEEQGDGAMPRKQADRIAAEIRRECGCLVKVLPAGETPEGWSSVRVESILLDHVLSKNHTQNARSFSETLLRLVETSATISGSDKPTDAFRAGYAAGLAGRSKREADDLGLEPGLIRDRWYQGYEEGRANRFKDLDFWWAARGKTESVLTAAEVSEQLKKIRPLSESAIDEPLEKSYIQFIKDGNVFSPAGKVVLVPTLEACPYKIKLTMAGPVFERVKPNTDEVMVFENSSLNSVVKEIDRFWSRKEAYDRLGLMHNRGILMYGPPGTGKSICLQQVVEMMAKRGDVVFFVDSPEAIIEGMKAFRQVEPNRKVVISFEEADEMCRYNERAMLRLMDGDAKVDGVLFLATTNYVDRLPERMLRPGRFDKKVFVGFPTFEHRLQYLKKKLTGIEEDESKIQHMAKSTQGLGFGHLRELIAGVYAIGDSMDDVLTALRANPIVDSAKYSDGECLKQVIGDCDCDY